jgi:dynein light intermediate chain
MEQSYYWNIHQEYHPKNRLLKYSTSSKVSNETLRILLQIRKTYHKLPPIIYSLQDKEANEGRNLKKKTIYCIFSISFKDIVIEHDIFGQQCHLALKDMKAIWQPTSFYVSDSIYKQIKRDLFLYKIDNDLTFLCLFPIYIDMNRKKQLKMGHQDEEIFLPSTTPSTQHDLNQLQERFNMMLYNEQALEIGLCPKRRRIYNDLFDELIRIITLQCSERGLLLGRIKNECVNWMSTYEELYSSGMAYGLRQYLYKIEEKQKYEGIIEKLENDCQQLHNELDKESTRYEKLIQLINNDDDNEQNSEQRLIKNNVNILRSTNEILRRDVQNTLNHILSSTIFLGEPIDYDKETD